MTTPNSPGSDDLPRPEVRATERAGRTPTVGGPLYHLALRSEWEEARTAGAYRRSTLGASLDEVGFIHASDASQLHGTAARYYGEVVDPLVVLVIEPSRLGCEVVLEAVPGGQRFPHIYGPIPLDAVVETRPARMVGGHLQFDVT